MKKLFMFLLVLLIAYISVSFSENCTDVYKISFSDDERGFLLYNSKEHSLILYDKDNAVKDVDCQIDFDAESGTYRVKISGIYGFLNSNFDWIVEPVFEWATPFGRDGIAEVSIPDPNGSTYQLSGYLISNEPWFVEDGIAIISIDGLYAYIRSDGSFLCDPIFEKADPFASGIARVKKDGLYGYITSDGIYLFEPQFEEAEQFFSEPTVVSLNGEFGLVDRTGEYVLNPSLQYIWGFGEYDTITRAEYNNRWGFINRNGDFIIEPVFSEISYSMYGCYIVKGRDFLHPESEEMYGLVDWEGNLLLNPIFESITIDTYDGIVHADHPSGIELILILNDQYWIRLFEENGEDDGFDWDSFEYDKDSLLMAGSNR